MVACNVFAADTVEEARFLATTMQQGLSRCARDRAAGWSAAGGGLL
jgi:alkanesulfonate monooxygenase SsuD/methylene tetrahydromethanopterin reductase-like flavin-dependent oxidoreductase (luciferase family)